MLQRFYRLKDAPRYLGMDRHRFNAVVRPHLTEIPIGVQGIAFDRLEIDACADSYKARFGMRRVPVTEEEPRATRVDWNKSASEIVAQLRGSRD